MSIDVVEVVIWRESSVSGGAGAFFFEAEDGIRDPLVTGVQTCALPIYEAIGRLVDRAVIGEGEAAGGAIIDRIALRIADDEDRDGGIEEGTAIAAVKVTAKIGRASCRERGEIAMLSGSVREQRSARDRG